MAHLGYTPEQVAEAEAEDHSRCDLGGGERCCIDENARSLHPALDDLDEAAQMVVFVLDRTSPTQDAYDAACRALAHYRTLADEATAALMRSSINAGEADQLRRRFGTPLRSTSKGDSDA